MKPLLDAKHGKIVENNQFLIYNQNVQTTVGRKKILVILNNFSMFIIQDKLMLEITPVFFLSINCLFPNMTFPLLSPFISSYIISGN